MRSNNRIRVDRQIYRYVFFHTHTHTYLLTDTHTHTHTYTITFAGANTGFWIFSKIAVFATDCLSQVIAYNNLKRTGSTLNSLFVLNVSHSSPCVEREQTEFKRISYEAILFPMGIQLSRQLSIPIFHPATMSVLLTMHRQVHSFLTGIMQPPNNKLEPVVFSFFFFQQYSAKP